MDFPTNLAFDLNYIIYAMPTQISVSKHQNIPAENMQVSDAPTGTAHTAIVIYIDRRIPIINVVQSILICDHFLKI